MDTDAPARNGQAAGNRKSVVPGEAFGSLDGKGVVIVALTGWGQEEDRRRSGEAGFDHPLVNPVEVNALEKLLAEGSVGRRT